MSSEFEIARAMVFHPEEENCTSLVDPLMSPVAHLPSPASIVDLRRTQRNIKRLVTDFRFAEEKRSHLQLELEKMLNDRNARLAAIKSKNIAKADQRFARVQAELMKKLIDVWRNFSGAHVSARRMMCRVMQGIAGDDLITHALMIFCNWKRTASRLAKKKYSNPNFRPRWFLLLSWNRWVQTCRLGNFESRMRATKLRRSLAVWSTLHRSNIRSRRLLGRAGQRMTRRLLLKAFSRWFAVIIKVRVRSKRSECTMLKAVYTALKICWNIWCRSVRDGFRMREILELRFVRTRQAEYQRKSFLSFLVNVYSRQRSYLVLNRRHQKLQIRAYKHFLCCWKDIARNRQSIRCKVRNVMKRILYRAFKRLIDGWFVMAKLARQRSKAYERIRVPFLINSAKACFTAWNEWAHKHSVRTKILVRSNLCISARNGVVALHRWSQYACRRQRYFKILRRISCRGAKNMCQHIFTVWHRLLLKKRRVSHILAQSWTRRKMALLKSAMNHVCSEVERSKRFNIVLQNILCRRYCDKRTMAWFGFSKVYRRSIAMERMNKKITKKILMGTYIGWRSVSAHKSATKRLIKGRGDRRKVEVLSAIFESISMHAIEQHKQRETVKMYENAWYAWTVNMQERLADKFCIKSQARLDLKLLLDFFERFVIFNSFQIQASNEATKVLQRIKLSHLRKSLLEWRLYTRDKVNKLWAIETNISPDIKYFQRFSFELWSKRVQIKNKVSRKNTRTNFALLNLVCKRWNTKTNRVRLLCQNKVKVELKAANITLRKLFRAWALEASSYSQLNLRIAKRFSLLNQLLLRRMIELWLLSINQCHLVNSVVSNAVWSWITRPDAKALQAWCRAVTKGKRVQAIRASVLGHSDRSRFLSAFRRWAEYTDQRRRRSLQGLRCMTKRQMFVLKRALICWSNITLKQVRRETIFMVARRRLLGYALSYCVLIWNREAKRRRQIRTFAEQYIRWKLKGVLSALKSYVDYLKMMLFHAGKLSQLKITTFQAKMLRIWSTSAARQRQAARKCIIILYRCGVRCTQIFFKRWQDSVMIRRRHYDLHRRIWMKIFAKVAFWAMLAWQQVIKRNKRRNRARSIVQFKVQQRVLLRASSGWKRVCDNLQAMKRNAEKLSASCALRLVSRTLSGWLLHFQKSKRKMFELAKIFTCLGKNTLQRAWLQWLVYYKYREALKRALVMKLTSKRKKSKASHLEIWRRYTKSQKRNQSCISRSSNKSDIFALAGTLQQWFSRARLAAKVRRGMKVILFRQITAMQRTLMSGWREWARKKKMHTSKNLRLRAQKIQSCARVAIYRWQVAAKEQRRTKSVVMRALRTREMSTLLDFMGFWSFNVMHQQRYKNLLSKLTIDAKRRAKISAFTNWLHQHKILCTFYSVLLQLRKRIAIRLLSSSFQILVTYFNFKRRQCSTFLAISKNTELYCSNKHFSLWCVNVAHMRRWKRQILITMLRSSRGSLLISFENWRNIYKTQRIQRLKTRKITMRRRFMVLSLTLKEWKKTALRLIYIKRKVAIAFRGDDLRSMQKAFFFWQQNVQRFKRERIIVSRAMSRIQASYACSAFELWRFYSKKDARLRWRSQRTQFHSNSNVINQAWSGWKNLYFGDRRVQRLLSSFKYSQGLSRMSACLSSYSVSSCQSKKYEALLRLVMRVQNISRCGQCFAEWQRVSGIQKRQYREYVLRSKQRLMTMRIRKWRSVARKRHALYASCSRFLLCMFANILEKFWHRWCFRFKCIKAHTEKTLHYQTRMKKACTAKACYSWTEHVKVQQRHRGIYGKVYGKSVSITLSVSLHQWFSKVRLVARVRRCLRIMLSRKVSMSQGSILLEWRTWASKHSKGRFKMSKAGLRQNFAEMRYALESWRISAKEQQRVKWIVVRAMNTREKNSSSHFFGVWSMNVKQYLRYRGLLARHMKQKKLITLGITWRKWVLYCSRASYIIRCQVRLQKAMEFKVRSGSLSAWKESAAAHVRTRYRMRIAVIRWRRNYLCLCTALWRDKCFQALEMQRRFVVLVKARAIRLLRRAWTAMPGQAGKDHIHVQIPSGSIVTRLFRRCAKTVFSGWKACSLARIKHRVLLSRALCKSMQLCITTNFHRWMSMAMHLRGKRSKLARAIARIRSVVGCRAMSTWKGRANLISMVRRRFARLLYQNRTDFLRSILIALNIFCSARRGSRRVLLAMLEKRRLRFLRRTLGAFSIAVCTSRDINSAASTAARRGRDRLHLKTWVAWRVAANEQRCCRFWRKADEGKKAAGLLLAAWDGAALLSAWDCLKANTIRMRSRRLAIVRRADRRRGRALVLSMRRFRANAALGTQLAKLALRLLRRWMGRSCRLWRIAVELARAARRRAEGSHRRHLCVLKGVGWRLWAESSNKNQRMRTLLRLALSRLRRMRLPTALGAWREAVRRRRAERRAEATGARRRAGELRTGAWRRWSEEVRLRAAEAALEEQREELGRVAELVQRFASVSHETIALCDGAAAAVDTVVEYDVGDDGLEVHRQ